MISKIIVANAWYNSFIMACIVIAGTIVGIQTYPEFEKDAGVNAVNYLIQSFFTVDIVVKVCKEGPFPWNYW